jgi:hypothetical protein
VNEAFEKWTAFKETTNPCGERRYPSPTTKERIQAKIKEYESLQQRRHGTTGSRKILGGDHAGTRPISEPAQNCGESRYVAISGFESGR